MRITIPEEYRDRFGSEKMWIRTKEREHCNVKEYAIAYVSRYKDHSLLLMNEEEHKRLTETLGRAEQSDGFSCFLKAGIEPAIVAEGALTLPEWANDWIGGGELNFELLGGGLKAFSVVK